MFTENNSMQRVLQWDKTLILRRKRIQKMAWCTTGRISVATTWSSLLIGIEYKSNFGIINLTNKI